MDRRDPDVDADERATLAQHLELQRATLLWKAEGLDAAALARRLEPSAETTNFSKFQRMSPWWPLASGMAVSSR